MLYHFSVSSDKNTHPRVLLKGAGMDVQGDCEPEGVLGRTRSRLLLLGLRRNFDKVTGGVGQHRVQVFGRV